MCVPGTKYTAHSDNHFNFKISIKYKEFKRKFLSVSYTQKITF
jgi:hypothetical protein